MIKITAVAKILKIYPRTKKSWMIAWDLAAVDYKRKYLPREVVTAADGIKYALGTGRANGTVSMNFRKLTSYQTLKVLVDVANNVQTMAEVGRYLNKNYTNF